MRITIYEFAALFSLLAVGYAAGWCFKGLWDKEMDDIYTDRFIEEFQRQEGIKEDQK